MERRYLDCKPGDRRSPGGRADGDNLADRPDYEWRNADAPSLKDPMSKPAKDADYTTMHVRIGLRWMVSIGGGGLPAIVMDRVTIARVSQIWRDTTLPRKIA